MLDTSRISARHYYDYLPRAAHRCGDVWTNLPTFGLLGDALVSGLIVTPACDLSNNKTETVTYLPIIPVRAYFSTKAALPLLKSKTLGNLSAGEIELTVCWTNHDFRPPKLTAIEAALRAIGDHLAAKQRGTGQTAALGRAQAGLRLIGDMAGEGLIEAQEADLALLFGKEWNNMLGRIIRNGFSTDMHFLPSDGQDPTFSGVPRHSVALFRYPITAPIEVFDLAQDASVRTWPQIIKQHEDSLRALRNYERALPVKALSLNSGFLADLLSRYVGVYNRIGSPDFTGSSIARMIEEVRS